MLGITDTSCRLSNPDTKNCYMIQPSVLLLVEGVLNVVSLYALRVKSRQGVEILVKFCLFLLACLYHRTCDCRTSVTVYVETVEL